MLKSFSNKLYRNYFFAVILSLTGVGFFLYTMGWYVLHLTENKLSVGLAWSMFFTPGLFFLPIMGKLLDIARVKRTLIIIELIKAGILFTFIPILFYFPNVYLVYFMSALFGIFFSVFIPSVFVVLKKIVADKDSAKYSHLLELSFQIGSAVSILCSNYLYEKIGFLFLIGIGGVLMALSGFVMTSIHISSSDNSNRLNIIEEYKKFFSTAKEVICKSTQNRKMYLFGIFHQLPQNIVLALNIPLLLYVYETMEKGPIQYGILDSLIGISAMFAGLFWTKYYIKGQEKQLVIIMPLFAAIVFIAISFIAPLGIIPYLMFFMLSIFLTSSKVQCRAAILKKTPAEVMGRLTSFYQTGSYIVMLSLTFSLSYLCQHMHVQNVFLIIGFLMLGFGAFLKWAYAEE